MLLSNDSLAPPIASSIRSELWAFIELAIPTILVNLGMIASPIMLCASFVGRKFEPVYLSGFALANLTGNLCTFSIILGIFSASDTLGPQAFGAGNHKEVGMIAIRGFVCAASILLPINIFLVMFLDDVLIALGQEEEAVELGVAWYRIFVWSFGRLPDWCQQNEPLLASTTHCEKLPPPQVPRAGFVSSNNIFRFLFSFLFSFLFGFLFSQ